MTLSLREMFMVESTSDDSHLAGDSEQSENNDFAGVAVMFQDVQCFSTKQTAAVDTLLYGRAMLQPKASVTI